MKRDEHAATCSGCVHFFITYEPSFPYGCRSMGFKSRRHPYLEVLALTGEDCVAREEKANGGRARGES